MNKTNRGKPYDRINVYISVYICKYNTTYLPTVVCSYYTRHNSEQQKDLRPAKHHLLHPTPPPDIRKLIPPRTFILCKQSCSIHYSLHVGSLHLVIVPVFVLNKHSQNFNRRMQTQSLSPLPPLQASHSNTRLQNNVLTDVPIHIYHNIKTEKRIETYILTPYCELTSKYLSTFSPKSRSC